MNNHNIRSSCLWDWNSINKSRSYNYKQIPSCVHGRIRR